MCKPICASGREATIDAQFGWPLTKAAWLGIDDAGLRDRANSGGEPQAGDGRQGGEDADSPEMIQRLA